MQSRELLYHIPAPDGLSLCERPPGPLWFCWLGGAVVANRRMIERDISLNLKVADLSDGAALLFTWAIAHTDDYGVIHGDARRVKAEIVPLRDWTLAIIDGYLDEWVTAGVVRRYWYKGAPYILFVGFDGHQTGLEKRRRFRALPHPNFSEECFDTREDSITSEKFSEVPESSATREVKRSKENLKGKGIVPPVGGTDPVAIAGDPEEPFSEPPAGGQADPEPKAPNPSGLKRKRRTDAEMAEALADVRGGLPSSLLPTLEMWMDNLASHNVTGSLTAGRVLAETQGFADLVDAHGMAEASIRHGVQEALARTDRKDSKPGICSLAFVLECAKSFAAGGNGGNGRANRLPLDSRDPEDRKQFVVEEVGPYVG